MGVLIPKEAVGGTRSCSSPDQAASPGACEEAVHTASSGEVYTFSWIFKGMGVHWRLRSPGVNGRILRRSRVRAGASQLLGSASYQGEARALLSGWEPGSCRARAQVGSSVGPVGPGTACWPPSWDDRTLSQGWAGHTLGWGWGGSGFALDSELGGLSRDGPSRDDVWSGPAPVPWPQFLSRFPAGRRRRESVTLA